MLTRNIRRLMLLVMMCCGMAVTNAQTSYNLSITTEGVGAISYTSPTSSGVVDANMSNSFTIYEGEELQLTFTPGSDAYKLVTATMNSTNIMADMTGNTYTVSSVSGDVTIYGAFDIAIKHGTMQTTVIDGIEWTYTVTDETNKRCQLGAIDSLVNSITAVPTSTVAENLAIPSVINGYTVYGLSVEAFRNCSGLTGQLNIPETVTFIGDGAFQGTNFSGPLTLPSGLNDLCSYSFYNLYNLTGDLVIPESLTVLPAYAFFNCQGFTSLTLPAGVTNLWTRCFGQMYGLKQITCYATTPPAIGAENVFSDYTIPLFVPAESVDAYKAAQYWSNFTNIYAIGTELNHTLTVASSGGGKIVGAIKNLTGEIYSEFESNPDSDDPVEFPVTVPVGYSVEMTFTPNTGYYLYRVMKNDMEEISGQMVDNKLTLTDVNEDMKVSAEFVRTVLLLQVNSQTDLGSVGWEVNNVIDEEVTNGVVTNAVQDIDVPSGSTVTLTFNYDHTQYCLSQLTRNNVDVLADVVSDTYTITNYAKTDTITVSFAELPTEAYAALDGNTLTFYYDKQKTARGGMSVDFGGDVNLCEWYAHKDDITTVVFDSSMDNCTSLTSTASWFYHMTNLTTIQGLSNLHTDNVTDMHNMFFYCSSLASIDMASLNTSSVTNMKQMFQNCSSLTTLDLSSNNTANVTDMQLMFQNCTALTSINLGGQFSTASVTTMPAMFNGCSSLQSLDLTNFNTANVTSMFQMFFGCSQLASVMVGDGWTTAGASSDQLFADNDALVGGRGTAYADFGANDTAYRMATYARVDGGPQSETPGYFMDANTPTFYNIKVTVVGQGNAVATYSSNQTIIYSNSDNDFSVVRGESMTLAITPDTGYRLSTVVVDTTDVTSQVIADSTGVSYYTLTGIYDAHNVTVTFINDIDEAYAVYSEDYTVLTFYYDKKRESRNGMSVENTGILGDPGWHNSAASTNVKTVVFDPSFDAFRPTTTRYWFAEMSLLTTIEGMQYLHVDNVTTMGDMFSGCSGLVNLDLSGFNTANVTEMSSMFSGCSALQTIYVGSNWSTASVASGAYMFTGCTALVGSKGTTYDANHTDYTYAHIDGGPSNPGYFSDPNAPTSYTVKVTVVGNGSVTDGATTISSDSEQTLTVPAGQATVLTITAAPGYKLESVKNDTVNVMSQLTETEAGFTYNLGNVYDNYEITATFVNDTPEAYAVLSNDTEMGINTLLTFYYDTKKLERFGIDIIPFSSPADRGHWDNWCQTIQKVVIDTSFANYTNLTSTAYWFSGCLALKTIEGIENLKTQNVTDMHGMFESCSNLTNLVVTGFNTSNVTNMSNMFAQCSQLTSLDISNFDTSQATDLSRMFTSCASISSLDVSNFNTSNVMDMSGMFASCESLTSLNLSNFNTSKVTKMNSMFMSNIGLTTLDLTNFNTANVTDMGYMFASSNNLTTIYTGGNWTTAAVTESTSMFSDCTALVGGRGTTYDVNHTDVEYARVDGGAANPGYLTPQGGYVEAPTFTWNGDDLTMTTGTDGATIYYTMVDTSSPTAAPTAVQYTSPVTVTNDVLITAYAEKEGMAQSPSTVLNYPYTAWKALADAIADAQTVSAQAASNDNVTDTQRTELTDMITLSQGMYDARVDSASVINQQTTNLTTLTTTIQQLVNAEAEPYAVLSNEDTVVTFYYDKKKQERGGFDINNSDGTWPYCSATTAVIDVSFDAYRPTSTAFWFQGCSLLTTITGMEYLHTDDVTDMRDMFAGCSGLTSLDVSNFNTANVGNMQSMFNGCSGLTSLNVTNFNTEKLTTMHDMFHGCSGLTSLDLSNFNTVNVTDMWQVFYGCSGLTSLDVSGFNTANVGTMYGMFHDCSGLTSLDLSNFNTANVMDMAYMFVNCSSLTSIYVGEGWSTEKVTESGYMFYSCDALVGGKGTVVAPDHIDAAYAHIDGGAANPGYLTDINAPTTYTVTVDVIGGGSVTAGGETITEYTDYNREVSVDAGGSLLLTFTPADSHRLATVVLDGTDVTSQVIADSTGVSYYTLTGIYDDHTVTATFVDATIDVVGNTDFSSAWWTAFSSNYEIPADHTLHMQFTNHSDKVNNWDNWVLMCTADSTRTPEYFALRADSYGWGDYYNGDGLSSNWTDWDAFREGMDGALVDLTVRRWGSEVTVTTVAKAADDTEYVQTLTTTIDPAADQSINVFLTVENAYLEIYKNSITLTPSEAPAAYAVLSSDGTVVTFYYDTKKTERGGIDINNTNLDVNTNSPYGTATTAVFDTSFDAYRPTSTAYWFENCNLLTAITGIEYLHTDYVTDMRYMFAFCSGLTSLDVTNFNTANVTNMGSMFRSCSSLTSLDVSNFNTAKVIGMSIMFDGCSSLTSLDVSNFNTANVTHMEGMFYGCSGLTSLDVSNFNTANVTNMSRMFYGCSGLTSLDVTNFNTANVTNMDWMFYGCNGLKTIYVGEGWNTDNVTNSTNMFEGCTALVGGLGTVYDADHVDAAYAHIDGGTANPGYFSPLLQKGDANGDGDVNIADAVATVTNILGEPATGNFYRSMADMNGDDEIDIFDVTMIVNAALNANNPGGSRYMAAPSNIDRIAAEDVMLTAKADRLYLDIDRTAKFTAFQFDVTLPKGTELLGVKLGSAITDHQLSFVKRGDGQYRVVGLSMSNQVIDAASSRLIQLQLSDPAADRNVQVSNVLFVNPQAKDATGIGQRPTISDTQDGGYYDMNGRYMGTDRRQLSKGMYIKNHKKVIIK